MAGSASKPNSRRAVAAIAIKSLVPRSCEWRRKFYYVERFSINWVNALQLSLAPMQYARMGTFDASVDTR